MNCLHRNSRCFLLLAFLFGLTWAAADLSAQDGYLRTRVNPGRAGVFVDGKYIGPARDFGVVRWYSLSPGEHRVVLREPRYKEFATTIKIEAGRTSTLDVGLERLQLAPPPYGTLRTKSKSRFDAVFLNEHYMGHADEFNNFAQGLLLPPGEYDLMIQSRQGQEFKQKIKIEANKTTLVTAPF